jgi:hypothetical protein
MSKRNDVTAGETALRCSVDSDTLMTLRLAVIEFLRSFRAAYVAIARGVYSVTCPDGTSLAGAIPAISNRNGQSVSARPCGNGTGRISLRA